MSVTGGRARWMGAGTDIHKPGRGSIRLQRQRHYQAIELPGGGQVCVNDIVETDNEQRRLAQVLCMWEDASSGLCKFRARWLVRAADLPDEVLPRLQLRSTGRRSMDATSHTGSPACDVESRPSTSASLENSNEGNKGDDAGEGEDEGDNEVFLTWATDDLDLSLMVRLVVPSLEAVGASHDIRADAARRGQTGPRLSHSIDHLSMEFAPLAVTHPIFARARARRVEAAGLVSRVATDNAADRSSRPPVTQTKGWMPLKRGRRAATGGGFPAVAPTPLPPQAPPSSAPSAPVEPSSERPATRGIERGSATGVESSHRQKADGDGPASMADGESVGGESISGSPVSVSLGSEGGNEVPRNPKHRVPTRDDTREVEATSTDAEASRSPASPSVDLAEQGERPVAASAEGRGHRIPSIEQSAAALKVEDCLSIKIAPANYPQRSRLATRSSRQSAQTPESRTDSAFGPTSLSRLAPSLSSEQATLPKPRISEQSTTGKRKRTNGSTRRQSAADGELQGSKVEDTPRRTILVGDERQASIPNLLSGGSGSTEVLAEGTSEEECAKVVWGGIRDWNHGSRGTLASYLQAERFSMRKKEGRAGVAVGVRLGEEENYGDDARSNVCRGFDGLKAWAHTPGGGGDDPGTVEAASSERSRMQAPVPLIGRVKGGEDELKALRKTGGTQDHLEPALNDLSHPTTRKRAQAWTLAQVKMLEDNIEQSVHRSNRAFCHKIRPGVKLDQEDFVDLAAVSKSIPGKTPAQVLDFYFRHFAVTRSPPIDHVQGLEAADTKKAGAVSAEDSGVAVPPSVCAVDTSARRSATSGGQSRIGTINASQKQAVVTASQDQAAARSHQTNHSSREIGGDPCRDSRRPRQVDGGGAAAGSFGIEPDALEVNDSDRNYGGRTTAGAQEECSSPPRPALDALRLPATREGPVPPPLHMRDGRTEQERAKEKYSPNPGEPRALNQLSRADDRTRGGGQRRDRTFAGVGGDGWGASFRSRNHDLSAKSVGTDKVFGFMSSCWRLLERASDHLDKEQLEYMRGLIIAHARKPMSREQLLTRAMSCLENQPHVCASFVRTFDQLDKGPMVPLFNRCRSAPPATRMAASPSSFAMLPFPHILPAVSWTTAPPDQTRAPPFQHQLRCGGALPKREGPDFPRRPSRWTPRYATSSGQRASTIEACKHDQGMVATRIQSALTWRWEDAPAGGNVRIGEGSPWDHAVAGGDNDG